MVFKKIIFQNSLMANETPSRPPPFMANAILNFHFDFPHTSLICTIPRLSWCWVPSYAVASCALSARSTTWADASDQARVFEHFNRECLNIFNFSFLLVLILHSLQYKRIKLLPLGMMPQTKRECLNIFSLE